MARSERFFVEEMPEADGRAEILFLGTAALGTVELQITGPDIATLRRLGAQVTDAFHRVAGTRAVRNDWENAVLKLRVDIDQERARRAGVNSEDIARTLSAYFDGETISAFREGDTTIPIAIRAQASDRGSLDRVRTVEVLSPTTGTPVPLVQIAEFAVEFTEGIGRAVEPSSNLLARLQQWLDERPNLRFAWSLVVVGMSGVC